MGELLNTIRDFVASGWVILGDEARTSLELAVQFNKDWAEREHLSPRQQAEMLGSLTMVLHALGFPSGASLLDEICTELGVDVPQRSVATTGDPEVFDYTPVPIPSQLAIGEIYTREEINRLMGGGSIQEYLPHVRGRVVCGAFTPASNPDAPETVLVTHGPNIMKWASVFARQRFPVPIFLKRFINGWEYVGNYEVIETSQDPNELGDYSRRSNLQNLAMILRLVKRNED